MFSLIGISNTWIKPDKPMVFSFNPKDLYGTIMRLHKEMNLN